MKTRPIAVFAIAASLAAPAAAHGATVSIGGTAGPSADEYVRFTAGRGEANRVLVNFGSRAVTIVDLGVNRVRLGDRTGRCRRGGRRRVVCPLHQIPGGNRKSLSVFLELRDRDDTARFAPGTELSERHPDDPLAIADSYEDTEGAVIEASNVDAGSGNDVITGSRYADVIAPGPGRDRVEGRGGNDDIRLSPDGSTDSIRAGGGIDGLDYFFSFPDRTDEPVTVDLAARRAGGAGERDRVHGFEQVHGGPKDDVLLGSRYGDALYGEAGSDRIVGREGNDMLAGDSPIVPTTFVNDIDAGPGDDVVDARSQGHPERFDPSPRLAPTTTVDCGPGSDTESGDVDDRLDASCEAVAFRIPEEWLPLEEPHYDTPMKTAPVARAADGSPTFEVPCPAATRPRAARCSGTVAIERPPVDGSGGSPENLGSGSFDLEAGQRTNVHVELNAAGQAAVASGSPVAVHVTATLTPPPGDDWGSRPVLNANFGWQTVLGP